MPILTQPAFGPKVSIAFITGGALIDVWTLVWRYTVAPDTLSPNQQFWYWGLLLTGVTFVVIGAFLGEIGRAARKAEMPPTDEAARAEAAVQANAAASPNPMVGAAAVAPGMMGAAPMAPQMPVAPAAPPAGTVYPGQVNPGLGR